jgi:predicted dehydrogenase
MKQQPSTRITRRAALKLTAGVAAFPLIVPNRVFGQDAPSNTLRLGCIGVGRMGRGDMKECLSRGLKPELNARVVAVCDFDANRAAFAKQEVEAYYAKSLKDQPAPEVKAYGDFREMLARKDIDGVTISTPDHWHALCGIAAANAGKDIYIQKPMTYSLVEGQRLVEAVRKNKVILQVGSQQRSAANFRQACELVRNDRLGKLRRILVWLPEDHGTGVATPMPVPENLNYDMWLGPTPKAPYTEHRVHPQKGYSRPGWLQIERYSRGMITGWGAHMNDIAQWGHGGDADNGPVEIEATGEFPDRGLFDVHTKYHSRGRYADGVELIQETGSPAGVRFEGDDGWIKVWRGGIQVEPESLLKETIGDDGVKLYVSNDHKTNFLECMRTRKEPVCPVEVGHRSNSICIITHIAMKLGRKLRWDPHSERFVNDDDANNMLDFDHRQPWVV